jgi:hypothetical protein
MTGMKFCALLACFTSVLAVVEADPRDFTNTEGKTINGEVLSVSTTHAAIKRGADQKIFSIPLASLSAADKEFLSRWREDNPEFNLSFVAKKESEKPENERNGGSQSSRKIRSQDVSYRVTVTNNGKSTSPVAQMFFYSQLEENGKPAGLYSQQYVELAKKDKHREQYLERYLKCNGTLELPAIDPGKSVDLTTPIVQLVETSSVTSNRNEGFTEEHISKSKDTISGISLIVQYREREVAAWTTPGSDKKLILFRNWLRDQKIEKLRAARMQNH